jgi:hypothetical protein
MGELAQIATQIIKTTWAWVARLPGSGALACGRSRMCFIRTLLAEVRETFPMQAKIKASRRTSRGLMQWYGLCDTIITSRMHSELDENSLCCCKTATELCVAQVAALSGGGVAPGDVVGGSDVALIQQTCRMDGTLLKPTTPATYIDRTWETLFALPDKGGAGAGVTGLGETSSADVIVSGLLYKIFYVLPPTAAATIEPADVGLAASDSHVVYTQTKYGSIPSVKYWGSGPAAVQVVPRKCGQSPISCDKTQLFIAAPILSNRWSVLGETTKIVAVSAQRISRIGVNSGGGAVEVDLIGSAGETIEMAFADPRGSVLTVRCAIGVSGRAHMLVGATAGQASCQHSLG